MARPPTKHGRDQTLDFQGFLNDLQDWEQSINFGDRNTKSRPSNSSSSSARGPYDYMTEERSMDAASEKELGNEYFKQKKYNEAIECYSRSIIFSPTAVAHANRAMAYLKIRRFQKAEDDCTEALNLDDRYIKAYSRRVTARKELGKLKEAMEDAEFALTLEPDNQEIKKQYAEVLSLYKKKVSGAPLSSIQGAQKGGSSEKEVNELNPQKDKAKENNGEVPAKKSVSVEEVENKNKKSGSRSLVQEVNNARSEALSSSYVGGVQRNSKSGRKDLVASVQELASRAASRTAAEAAKNVTPPNSAYQFEASWRSFSGDSALQARLLKDTINKDLICVPRGDPPVLMDSISLAMNPSALPQIFKNALSAPLLIEIVKCVATFFAEDMDLAIKYLENLTKVPRFNMLIMCLSSADKTDLLKLWDEVFSSKATPIEYAEIVDNLRSMYCLKS